VTNATDVTQAELGTVHLYLDNQFNPPAGAYNVQLTFDSSVIAYVDGVKKNASNINPVGNVITINGFEGSGYPVGSVLLADLRFGAVADPSDGGISPITIKVNSVRDTDLIEMKTYVAIQNGTVATRDDVAPVINITTPATVSQIFAVTGTVTDIGGMGTASATLTGLTSGATQTFALPLTQTSASTWTFTKDVTWASYEIVNISVTATDAAGNTGSNNALVTVSPVGFSNPEPTGYINAQPALIRVFTQQIDPATVTMTLSGPATIPLGVTFNGDYAQNATVPALVDGAWTVNATGNDTIGGDTRYLAWTFTLDTVPPVINAFTITDTDGDGYVEAGEQLNFNWNVAGADVVHIMDNGTQEVFFTSTAATGSDSVTIPVGNREMVFAAFDNAGNAAYVPFHLYYNYMAWVNSTRMGTVSGIDMNLTALRQIDLTAQGSVTFYNAREAPLPPFGTIVRSVTHVGQVTNDTFVAVDTTANRTYTGAQTYDNLWTYNPASVLDFSVQAPNIDGAVLVILEANETYLASMIDEGRAASNVNYNDLFKQSAWFFINGGYCKYTINDIGTLSEVPGTQQGNPVTVPASGKIMDTLALAANQVDLNAGYRLNAQALPALAFPAGDYIIAAISVDEDRIGIIEVLPFTVMNTNEVGTVPASVDRGTSFDASFTTPARRVAAIVVRHDTWDTTLGIDASTIGLGMISANLTYGGIPATKKLVGNIYTSPNSATYVAAPNTTTVTVSTDGLLAGIYDVHLLAEHADGTVQAYGHHQINVRTPGAPVAAFTMTPSTGYTPLAVAFTDASTGNINTWAWEFGDGTTASTRNATHTYTVPGTYLVNLTVTGFGGTDTIQQTLVVTSPVPAAIFTATPTTGTVPLAVTFTDLSTGNITGWHWNFGDGTNATTRNATHTYTTVGTFTANLTVTGPLGNDSALATITVTAAPSPSGGGGGSSVSTSTSTGSATLLTASWGGVLKPYQINSDEGTADLYIATGVTALLEDGKTPVGQITINDLESDEVPAVPSGATFSFLGYAVECSPAGATFSPAIDLTFTLTDEEWADVLEQLDGNLENLVVKWYNPLTGVWEHIPTTVDAVHHTVTASITHFSTYGLFSDVAIVTPVTQEPTTPTTTAPVTTAPATTAPTPSEEGGFPWLWVIVIIVIIAVAAGAYFYMQRQ